MAGLTPREPADPYRVLGVPADASRADIVRAYRTLARGAHPDTRADDSAGEDRFDEVTRAYRLLSDPERRARYDRAHPGEGRAARGPAGPAGPARGAGRPGWPPIWAGPVHVEPPGGPVPARPPWLRTPPGGDGPDRWPGMERWPGTDPAGPGPEDPVVLIGLLLLRYLRGPGGW